MIRLSKRPTPRVTALGQSVLDMFRTRRRSVTGSRRMSPTAPSLDADFAMRTQCSSICSADWDVLFHAIQTRLENCISDTAYGHLDAAPPARNLAIKRVVSECVDAMRHLHRELVQERELTRDHL